MGALTLLTESDAGQRFINENEEAILEATEVFHQSPQKIKDHIYENLDQFVVPGDVQATHNKMTEFVESAVVQLLNELCDDISQ